MYIRMSVAGVCYVRADYSSPVAVTLSLFLPRPFLHFKPEPHKRRLPTSVHNIQCVLIAHLDPSRPAPDMPEEKQGRRDHDRDCCKHHYEYCLRAGIKRRWGRERQEAEDAERDREPDDGPDEQSDGKA